MLTKRTLSGVLFVMTGVICKLNLATCTSASFYTEVIAFSYVLEKLSMNTLLPMTPAHIKAEGRENEEIKSDWTNSPIGYPDKVLLIRRHFEEISSSDAIFVVGILSKNQYTP
jgi:hypothetical protein